MTTPDTTFDGKTVFISGGTSGINLGIARVFAARGAKVLVFGRDAEKADAAAALINQAGGHAIAGSADVRDPAAVTALFAKGVAAIGNPDIVIAGAAGNFMAPAAALSPNGFKTVVDIDLMGTFNVFRAAYDIVNKPGAALIAITAPQGAHPLPFQAHVCAAKAGVNMLVKCLALEWGQAGIRVNAIAPGPIEGTEGVERMAPSEAAKTYWTNRTALRRFGTTLDIAEAAAYLAGPHAGYVTGTILDCDGGMQLGDAAADMLTIPPRR
jgi:NAD(P)-dependent dehydrogenase (short-subunit alcohol dehydrogenase family)